MHWRKKLLHHAKLYLILDTSVNDYDRLFMIVRAFSRRGPGIVQLRDKAGNAKEVLRFSKRVIQLTRHKILYIINDRVDLALAVDADGVHLGQNDLPLASARHMVHKDQLIGISAQSWKHVQQAQQGKADYVGFGSVFQTLTKPERQAMDLRLLSTVIRKAELPVFAIGGITVQRVPQVQACGASRVAVCRDICQAPRPANVIMQYQKILQNEYMRG